MSVAVLALLVGCISLVVSVVALWWQVLSWRLARRTQLEVRFGHIPSWNSLDSAVPVGVEVVNHSDFAVSVQDVQLVVTFGDYPEPVIVGLGANAQATIPGVVQPHDSGFIASGLPHLPGADEDDAATVRVFANAITAVGNVRTPAYDVEQLPPFPAPMRFSRLFSAPETSDSAGQ